MSFKSIIIGIVIGVLIGLWVGVNIGKNKPIWSNPLEERSLASEAKTKAKDMIKGAKKAVRDSLEEKAP